MKREIQNMVGGIFRKPAAGDRRAVIELPEDPSSPETSDIEQETEHLRGEVRRVSFEHDLLVRECEAHISRIGRLEQEILELRSSPAASWADHFNEADFDPTHLHAAIYRQEAPQRYHVNYDRYLKAGGCLRPDVLSKFLERGRRRDISRFYFLWLAYDQLVKENIKGDFAELGVYKGSTASILANMARLNGAQLYLFDTFEGFSDKDLVDVDAAQKVQFGDTSLESVRQYVGSESVRYVKGRFPESLDHLDAKPSYALAHIDCDLYLPFKSALDYFWENLTPGGFLVMHDYGSLWWDGAEKAVDEFFVDKAETVILLPDASGSAVVRKRRF